MPNDPSKSPANQPQKNADANANPDPNTPQQVNLQIQQDPNQPPVQISISGAGLIESTTPGNAIALQSPRPLLGAGDSGTDGSFFSQLQGIPIDYLIATPLISSARANLALAEVMTQFIDELGFESDGKTTRMVSFQLTRPYQDPVTKAEKTQTITVNAPLLGLVPLPALLVQSVTVDLTVEISNQVSQTSNQSVSTQLQVGANWGWGNASFTGSYSNSQQNTRSTNQSAKYEVTVNAQQQATPEGMSRLMDVMASCITPIPTSSS